MQIYKVGGAVRDKLLNLPIKDIDWVVVGASPEELLDQNYRQVGKDFPVFLHPKTHEEYALARKERKVAAGYTGFEFDASRNVTLEEDLIRRDLTINAMAEDDQGNIIDPYNGQADLKKGILRHVSGAFSEDPVRILRVARFAARFGFEVAEETLELMKEMVSSGEVDALVAERVWVELERTLGEDHPERFFEVLRSCGALAVIFPEIDRLFGIPQTAKYHPEIDTGIHVMMVLQQAVKLTQNLSQKLNDNLNQNINNKKLIRFAALVHDLGKGTTPEHVLPSHHGHEQRGVDLIKNLCNRIKIPNDYRELGVMMAQFHTNCHRVREMKASTILKKLEEMDVFRKPERFDQFLIVCEADAKGRTGKENDQYPQGEYFKSIQLAVAAVDTKSIIADGIQGAQIAIALREKRLEVIKQIKVSR